MGGVAKSVLVSLVVLAFILPVKTINAGFDRFNPDGSFWVLGKAAKGFEDFGGFNLNTNHDRRLPAAQVELTNGTHLRFKTLSVTRSNLTFVTVTVRGVSYAFKGKFLQGGTFAARDLQDTPVLEGMLQKIKDGRILVETKLKFSYFGGT